MKTQLSKPARSHARYTAEYKEQALELGRHGGVSPFFLHSLQRVSTGEERRLFAGDGRLGCFAGDKFVSAG